MSNISPFRSAKRQRLILAMFAVVAVVAAGLIAAQALREEVAFFRSPSEILAVQAAVADKSSDASLVGKPLRLGAMVAVGSVRRIASNASGANEDSADSAGDASADSGLLTFVATDGKAQLSVEFAGIPPDLFAEGAGMVADGYLRADGTFVATRILAKHDENYRPPMLESSPSTVPAPAPPVHYAIPSDSQPASETAPAS